MKAIVSLSGGLDSAVVLAYARAQGFDTQAVGFCYGSKHNQYENKAALGLAAYYQVRYRLIDLTIPLGNLNSNLLMKGGAIPEGHYQEESMKQTVVPGRNIVFLAVLAAIAESEGADRIFIGVHAGDHCLPLLTPISTKRGLIPICDIEPGRDEVMSFDKDTNQVCWKKVLDRIEKGIPSTILKIRTKSGAVLKCTDEHDVYVVNRTPGGHGCYNKTISKKRAGMLAPGDFLITAAGEIDNGEPTDLDKKVDLLPLSPALPTFGNPMRWDDESVWYKEANKVRRHVELRNVLKLICWYVAEGCPANGNSERMNRYGVYISQSEEVNKENLDDIISTAESWGFKPSIHGEGGRSQVYFSGPTTRVLRNCGESSKDQKLPEWMLSLSNEALLLIFNTLLAGDGTREDLCNPSYITSSRYLISQMAYIGNRLGYKASVSKVSGGGCRSVNFYKAEVKPNINRIGQGAFSPIVSIKRVKNIAPVYDLSIEGTHNFFAGTKVPILVSNSIYPDCRPEFIVPMAVAIEKGTYKRVGLMAPFLMDSKATIVRRGISLAVPFGMTRTCYSNQEVACGRCGSCQERLEAFQLNGEMDPLPYVSMELIPKTKDIILGG